MDWIGFLASCCGLWSFVGDELLLRPSGDDADTITILRNDRLGIVQAMYSE